MTLFILTYLAGVLTILSPCILPVLPFVFARSERSFFKNGLPLLLGMSLTFSLLSAVAIAGGEGIARLNEYGRLFALVLMGVLGLSLVFSQLADRIFAPWVRLGSRFVSQSRGGVLGAFGIGMGTGLLWAPCAGPILGLVLTGAASSAELSMSIGLLLSYSLGAATSLALALVAGGRFLGAMKRFLGVDRIVKRVLGVAVLAGVAVIALNLDRTVLTQLSQIKTATLETRLLERAGVNQTPLASGAITETTVLPDEGEMPSLDGAVTWFHSESLRPEDLRGRVVLIDFWTYSCINCLRTLPFIKAWHERYREDGLVIIGVHTPEFGFEKNRDNVQKAIRDLGITYPVAVDNDYKIWNAFQNRYWPAQYFVDRKGRLRHRHFGEGSFDQSEAVIRNLLQEEGARLSSNVASAETTGVGAIRSRATMSHETYLGYARATGFAGELRQDQTVSYMAPAELQEGEWALHGRWDVERQRVVSRSASGKIVMRFRGRDLHLVLGSADREVEFRVKLDGHVPGAHHGLDVDAEGRGRVKGHRLYQLLRLQPELSGESHLLEIEFLYPGVEAYAFTFG